MTPRQGAITAVVALALAGCVGIADAPATVPAPVPRQPPPFVMPPPAEAAEASPSAVPDPSPTPDAAPPDAATASAGPEPLPPAAVPAAPPALPQAMAAEPFRQTGLASWYGQRHHGRRTASGERFDMHAMTAAHRTLPIGSLVRVRNPANGAEVLLRINDRGPFHRGRIVDLSRAAAEELGVLHRTAMVELQRVAAEFEPGPQTQAAPAAGVPLAAARPTRANQRPRRR